MRPLHLLIGVWTLAATMVIAAESGKKPDEIYARARADYEGGNYAAAVAGYNSLLTDGYTAFEVFYNLGNAYYRSGAIGLAVASYRRAYYLQPRDPDVRANMRMAQQQTGALQYVEPGWLNALGQLSRRSWMLIGSAGLWLAGLAGAAYWLWARPRWLGRLALAGLLALLVGSLGWLRWNLLTYHPEAVIISRGVQSLFAPLHGAMPHFALPEGSIVRIREQSGSWYKVEVGRQEGWIHAQTCDRLSPP